VRKDGSPVARALEVLILTAVRTGDLRFARWCEFDLDEQLWTIPKARMKMRKDAENRIDHEVPLSKPVLRILKAIKGDRKPGDYVFAGVRGHLLYERAMLKKAKKINPKVHINITNHGFRSTFRDWAGDKTKHDSQTAELALAHKVGGVEGAYRRRTALEKRRDLMEKWAKYCESGEVISINTAA
jgi:integrase